MGTYVPAVRKRLINRRQQGDLGEVSAIDWLTRQGATVALPIGHSPDYDVLAEIDGRLLRIQVKSSTVVEASAGESRRWSVAICTNGGNQSWTGTVKVLDPGVVDRLFVLVGDGRRWFIPTQHLEASRALTLGGEKYSEFEIEPADPILDLVYESELSPSTIGDPATGERRSGRAGVDCKSIAQVLSGFESLLPHPHLNSIGRAAPGERKLGRAGQAIVRGKRQMTVPFRPFAEAGLEVGDRIRFRADGPGRVILERIEPRPD
jgi:hypothetical protein